MTRVAAIDCGTNSLRLLVADVDPEAGTLVDVERRMEIVRLGKGVDRTGRLDDEALTRTLTTLATYAARIDDIGGVERVRMVATSATRDAANRDVFVDGVRTILRQDPEVVSGEEEARLSFVGATRGLPSGYDAPHLVVDIGGGSTELVLGASSMEAAVSVDIGSVRLTERHLRSDPPTAEQIVAARADVDAALDLAARTVPLEKARTLVGVAGSVTTLGALHLGLTHYDATRTHLSRIPAPAVRRLTDWLLASSHVDRASRTVIHPGRIDILPAGALILRTLMDRLDLPEVVVSEHDILDGIAWSCV